MPTAGCPNQAIDEKDAEHVKSHHHKWYSYLFMYHHAVVPIATLA